MKNIYIKFLLLLLMVLPTMVLAQNESVNIKVCPSAMGYQWRVAVGSERVPQDSYNPKRAYMWISPRTERVKGVIFSCHNAMEQGVIESPEFREAMAQMNFAIVWLTPAIEPSNVFYAGNGAQKIFERTMRDLAEVSGYAEIEYAPVVWMGHSARASEPYNFGAWNPDRALALISLHGDSPHSQVLCCNNTNPDWGERTIDGIPTLMCVGEYEWGEFRIESAFPFMRRYPQSTLSLLCDAGHGHSDISEQEIQYLVSFIRKAVEYRMPEGWSGEGKPRLHKINPRDGWLADRWHKDTPPQAEAAPYDEYMGLRDSAFWYFDEEMVRLTEAYYARERGKESREIEIWQQGERVERLRFRPLEDGLSYRVNLKLSGSKATKEPIRLRRESGAVEIVDDSTLRVRFNQAGFRDRRVADLGVCAYLPADKRYKRAVTMLGVRIPMSIENGQPQTITFPALSDVKRGAEGIKLAATSTSGLSVEYYVEQGAAHIEGDRLIFDEMPPRAKLPMKVEVIAWQYGIDGKWQSAESVSREFYITE